jgi:hypothetical protein
MPPVMPKQPELSLWLRDLREKLITADTATNNLITALNTGIYIGDKSKDGCYRIVLSGSKLHIEIKESGAWVKVAAFKK